MTRSALPTVAGVSFADLRPYPLKVIDPMDPRLQVALARARMGVPRLALASASAEEIPVVAKVNNVAAWEAISEVRVGATIGVATDGNTLVTARIPVQRIEAIRQQPCVVSLKASQPVRTVLAETTRDLGLDASHLPPGVSPNGGAGVIVGIVDFGGDFAHQNFRKPNGRTRILALWNQGGVATADSPFGYGRLYSSAEINGALANSDPYEKLGYGPDPDIGSQQGTHGTHVMDIAAGNGRGSGVSGCAPQADLVFVEASADKLPWFGPEAVGKSFGDSVQLLEAVKFIFDFAGERPCVVNLSLGTNGGPHDGTTLVEQGLDALVQARPNRAVVIAASNSHDDQIHAQGTVPAQGATELLWNTPAGMDGHEMEIWLPGLAEVALQLVAPDGTLLGTVEPSSNLPIGKDQDLVVFLSNRRNEPNNGDNALGIFLAGGLPAGQWKVRLLSRNQQPAPFHAWIERYDPAQSLFENPDPGFTLGSISCGRETIVVGSYDAHKSGAPISYFSSSGPTRDGREKPEVSAPGHAVLAARSRTKTGVTRKSGTSMASPAVSGLIALLFAEAKRRKITLTSAQLRQALVTSARKNPPDIATGTWDSRYGFGRVSGAALSL